VPVEERPLRAPEQERCEHAGGARPREPEQAEPVAEQRDEGYTSRPAQRYEAWLAAVACAAAGRARRSSTATFEHPGLTKLCAVSHRYQHLAASAVTLWRGGCRRSPSPAAQLLASACSGSRGRAPPACSHRSCSGARSGRFSTGHLACFDVPSARCGRASAWPGCAATGPRLATTYGLALAVKHNAWFLPPVLLVHALLLPRDQRTAGLRKLPWLLLSPAVLFVFWPLLWHDPLRHLRDWIAFHTHHVHYAWWYFGRSFARRPFPSSTRSCWTQWCCRLPTVALLAAAGISLLAGFARRRLESQRLLELAFAGAALLPFLLRTTPIFGGIKHWLAFVALLTPEAASLLARVAPPAAAARSGGSRHARRGRLADSPTSTPTAPAPTGSCRVASRERRRSACSGSTGRTT